MMQRPDRQDGQITEADLEPFEGLVHSTARIFAAQVRYEEEDLEQELRIVVWRAVRQYDPTRSRLPLERFVFGALTNKIRDKKRDAAREHDRRQRNGLSFMHIEDMPNMSPDVPTQEAFDGRYNYVPREEVYGLIEGDLFELPAGVTEGEANVLVLMMMDFSKPEIMLRLMLTHHQVNALIAALRAKFADWRPSAAAGASREIMCDALAA